MQGIKQVRENLGISQAQMAAYLNISRSCLAMAESKKRSLPTAAFIKLGKLENLLSNSSINPSAKALTTIQKQLQKHRSLINKHAERCSTNAEILNYQLKEMASEYKKCMKALQATAYILEGLGNSEANTTERLTMEFVELDTLKKLQHCNLGAQALLSLKIKALNYEADQAARIVF